MNVLTGNAALSGSSRKVKASARRFPTRPGSGAFCQVRTGANSQCTALCSPPARRWRRNRTVPMQTVPITPAAGPAPTAPSGASCLRVRAGRSLPIPVLSEAGALAAVDVQDLAGDERGLFEVHDRLDDVVDLAHPPERVQRGERAARVVRVHGSADDAE
ncbi:hypothetical protein GA0115254_118451 [Streptomyces sp. Ncost-T10-10d]|nr:hypothetical protein GA0115254_118451 [Streptomyces sp. Ncost-T10-10d]